MIKSNRRFGSGNGYCGPAKRFFFRKFLNNINIVRRKKNIDRIIVNIGSII